jgi:hypothetical protein
VWYTIVRMFVWSDSIVISTNAVIKTLASQCKCGKSSQTCLQGAG